MAEIANEEDCRHKVPIHKQNAAARGGRSGDNSADSHGFLEDIRRFLENAVQMWGISRLRKNRRTTVVAALCQGGRGTFAIAFCVFPPPCVESAQLSLYR